MKSRNKNKYMPHRGVARQRKHMVFEGLPLARQFSFLTCINPFEPPFTWIPPHPASPSPGPGFHTLPRCPGSVSPQAEPMLHRLELLALN